MAKIILDLCGGTGAWSKPYKNAGYDVRLITLPDYDVTKYEPPENVYGVLAAPPCTHFAASGAAWWKGKDKDGRTLTDLEVITHCLMIIAKTRPKFWVLENPVGRLYRWLGKPKYYFNPYEFAGYGDNPELDRYRKKTCLWGNFNMPEPKLLAPITKWNTKNNEDWHHNGKFCPKGMKIEVYRAITPAGFAKAFFEMNQ